MAAKTKSIETEGISDPIVQVAESDENNENNENNVESEKPKRKKRELYIITKCN